MKDEAEKKAAEEAAKVKAAADAEAKVSLRHNKMIMEAKNGFYSNQSNISASDMETITWQKLKEAAEKKEAELKAFLKAEEDQKKMEEAAKGADALSKATAEAEKARIKCIFFNCLIIWLSLMWNSIHLIPKRQQKKQKKRSVQSTRMALTCINFVKY